MSTPQRHRCAIVRRYSDGRDRRCRRSTRPSRTKGCLGTQRPGIGTRRPGTPAAHRRIEDAQRQNRFRRGGGYEWREGPTHEILRQRPGSVEGAGGFAALAADEPTGNARAVDATGRVEIQQPLVDAAELLDAKIFRRRCAGIRPALCESSAPASPGAQRDRQAGRCRRVARAPARKSSVEGWHVQ